MSIEIMKQALEALEKLTEFAEWHDQAGYNAFQAGTNAITSLRQAIADAEKQEPVAWIEHHKGGDNLVWDDPGGNRSPLYTRPQPKREWVGLTDEEIDEAARYCVKSGQSVNAAIRAIEAKLKEKNT